MPTQARPTGRVRVAGALTWRRRVATTAALVVALGATAACTPGPPPPDDAAKALAAALTRGDLAGVPLSGAEAAEATAQLTAATEGLAPATPVVEVSEVVEGEGEDEGTALATLAYTWDVDEGDQDWTYTTTAHLDLVEDEWVTQWSTFLLAPDLRGTETLTTRRLPPPERAPVLGAGGAVIVEPRAVLRLGFDKTKVAAADQPAAAAAVADVVGIDPAAYAAQVAAAGEKAFVEALVVREADPGVDVDALRAAPGGLAVPDTLPLAPTRRFARPVLGTVGAATAEIVEESGGAVQAGDLAGLSGLQRRYDDQLRGRAGLVVVAVASDNEQERELFRLEPTPGEPLRTTLLPAWQEAAETVLAGVGPASAIVALRASTGEVLAVASGPGGEGYSTATLGTFAPGSVFKVVSSLALLRAGSAPDSAVECPSSIRVEGRTFDNFPGYPAAATGTVPLRTAFAQSCNTAFIGLRDQAPAPALASAAAALGLGVDADLGFPAFLGAVPDDATGTDHAASMIGQGRIQASPLAMATVAASVASGRTVTPWLVGDAPPEPVAVAAPLTEPEVTALREMMRAVVTEGGASFLNDFRAPEVLAKTGTAQFGAGDDLRNHAWMIAIHGDAAIAVFVEDGDYGSTTSGPLLEQFLALSGA